MKTCKDVSRKWRGRFILAGAAVLILMVSTLSVFAGEVEGAAPVSNLHATIWSLVPPLIAIVLALLTKEVYTSLFIGIVSGALLHANGNVEIAFNAMLSDGFITKLSDSWNVGILIFLVVLGILVTLINAAGGSAAYGHWAAGRIRSKRGALGATMGLGVLIFVDDYFNCLTVGSVMRPVTDKFGISRAKLAYLIDATAAPICMIAPISSWAAAVSGVTEGYNGLELFVRAIPYNFYSLLTIVMMLFLIVTRFDYGSMRTHEVNAEAGDLYTTPARPYAGVTEEGVSARGTIWDLVLPIVILIISCIAGMVYTGGFFSGETFVNAFANCDASVGLALGSLAALILSFFIFVPRRVLSFRQFADAIPNGFKAMVPAILILTFAWTLSAMTSLLGADVFVAGLVENSAAGFRMLLPAVIFLVALGLAFSTGTSWGTFGILIPIIVSVMGPTGEMLILSISACLAGAVCGDHCSPISDTTIMASTGAQCDHVAHVTTQLPYALTVAAVSFVSYVIAGAVQSAWIALPIAIVLMLATLQGIRVFGGLAQKRKLTVPEAAED